MKQEAARKFEALKLSHVTVETAHSLADEGASLYDVLNLYNDKRSLIRDSLISRCKGIEYDRELLSPEVRKSESPEERQWFDHSSTALQQAQVI